ncbi:MAG: hypothetical protein IJ406_01610 [Oscillospiraceae bacterium]|nr:hypothetical protein [Oscillospiraceae bacterium]
MNGLKCSQCGSDNVIVQIVEEKEDTGCAISLICGILALVFFPIGLFFLIIPFATRGSVSKKYAVCQHCGHKWEI